VGGNLRAASFADLMNEQLMQILADCAANDATRENRDRFCNADDARTETRTR
jgi:hypothetical protein